MPAGVFVVVWPFVAKSLTKAEIDCGDFKAFFRVANQISEVHFSAGCVQQAGPKHAELQERASAVLARLRDSSAQPGRGALVRFAVFW